MLQGSKVLTSSQKLFWLNKYSQQPILGCIAKRQFSGAAHGLVDHHDDHGHHEQHVEKADPNHRFIANQDKRFIIFNGLTPNKENYATIEVVNQFRHHNDLSLTHHQHPFSGYSFAHSFEEEHNTHDMPFGYELGDDPFEEQGHGDYPFLLLFFGIISFVHFTYAHFNFNTRKTGEVLYHQRLTAFQIEDEIRRIREEDAPLREHL